MKRPVKIYNRLQQVAAIGMMAALLWLTVSLPFVYAAQQKWSAISQADNQPVYPESEEDAGNPYGNNTEEKAPSSTNLSEEFLHDHHGELHFFGSRKAYHGTTQVDTYLAFHGELLVPPPNLAS